MFARIQLAALVVSGMYFDLAVASPTRSSHVFTRQVPDCARTYTVALGDTCDSISVAQGVSTYQLATVNSGIINPACDNLAVDEVICLGIIGHDCTTVHEVVPGDYCFAIAEAAGITVGLLLENNPNVDSGCTNIYPGEVLCTAATAVYA